MNDGGIMHIDSPATSAQDCKLFFRKIPFRHERLAARAFLCYTI